MDLVQLIAGAACCGGLLILLGALWLVCAIDALTDRGTEEDLYE